MTVKHHETESSTSLQDHQMENELIKKLLLVCLKNELRKVRCSEEELREEVYMDATSPPHSEAKRDQEHFNGGGHTAEKNEPRPNMSEGKTTHSRRKEDLNVKKKFNSCSLTNNKLFDLSKKRDNNLWRWNSI